MRSFKKQSARQLTSAIMAIVMTATTTFQMSVLSTAAAEEMSSVAVESQLEEMNEASSVEVPTETIQESEGLTESFESKMSEEASADTSAVVTETAAEVTCVEDETSLPAEADPSGEDTVESSANETRGPDETKETVGELTVTETFTADRTWNYESYDAFAKTMTGVSLQRTEQVIQFYNTYVDPSNVQAGVTTIDSLLD